jgi:hypothetical protein
MTRFFITLFILAFNSTSIIAQEQWRSQWLMVSAGGAYELLLDRNAASILWEGGGMGLVAGYQSPIGERAVMAVSFAYMSAELSHSAVNLKVESKAFDFEVSLNRNFGNGERSALLVGAALNPHLSARSNELQSIDRVIDAWASLSANATYTQSVGQWVGLVNVSLPVLSGLITQDFANSGDHSLHLASLHNTQRVKTRAGVEYKLSSTCSVGAEYYWHYWRVRVAKPIDMARHRLGMVYKHAF